jgi:hypothetical protein
MGNKRQAAIALLIIGAIVAGVVIVSVGLINRPRAMDPSVQWPTLASIPDSAWQALSHRRILFGHQSVGSNLLEGIAEVASEDLRIPVQVHRLGEPGAMAATLTHFPIGENGVPESKTAAFLETLGSFGDDPPPFAGFKLCYIDFTHATDEQRIFDDYRRTVERVRSQHPDVRLIHFTVPLTVEEPWLKRAVKLLIGRKTTTRALNARRARYNAMLRREFGAREAVFDLAAAQSTLENGERVTASEAGAEVESLAPAFSDDGAHLNRRGRRVVAERFLAFLASLP